jgi:hypothetical protein
MTPALGKLQTSAAADSPTGIVSSLMRGEDACRYRRSRRARHHRRHYTVQLAEIGRFEDDVTMDDYLADFSGGLHDLRDSPAFAGCLDPDSYAHSQALAERLLDAGSLGVVYPSVRRLGGVCLACFRPALVSHVRKGATYRFRWSGSPTLAIEALENEGGGRK